MNPGLAEIMQKEKKDTEFEKLNSIRQMFKRVHRNMKNKVYKMSNAINQKDEQKNHTKSKLINYFANFFLKFDEILQENIELTN